MDALAEAVRSSGALDVGSPKMGVFSQNKVDKVTDCNISLNQRRNYRTTEDSVRRKQCRYLSKCQPASQKRLLEISEPPSLDKNHQQVFRPKFRKSLLILDIG